MKMSKSTKKKRSQGSGGGDVQQFFLWHSEKIVLPIIAVLALWFAVQGLGYQALLWQPSELEGVADTTKRDIDNSARSAEDEDLKNFDYAAHAEQIKKPVPGTPYRNPPGSEWNPPFEPINFQPVYQQQAPVYQQEPVPQQIVPQQEPEPPS
jgi:hypothetical protein